MESSIKILRALLDERGVKYEGSKRSLRWRDRYGIMMQAFPLANGELGMGVWSCTPEQAIAATLGREMCRIERRQSAWGGFTEHCSECGADLGCDTRNTQNFCPNCGRRIVDPTTNDAGVEVDDG